MININAISIQQGNFYITCNGMVDVSLQYGSDSEQEIGDKPMRISFPFKFKGTIRYDGKDYSVKDYNELKIDTDAYYM